MAIIAAVFKQLDDHKHCPSLCLFLSSASNFNTACRVHTHQRGAEAQGWTRQLTNPITPLFTSFFLSSPAFPRLLMSPCLFPRKLTDLNTYIHTHTSSQGGKSSLKPLCSHYISLFFTTSGSMLSQSFPLPCYLLFFFLCLSVSSLLADWQAGFSSWFPLIPA